jgi:formylglycine-generating enzyme required for sulfatase activity
MGSPRSEWGRGAGSEEPVAMTLTHDFFIGQTEVTQRAWMSLGYPNPSGLWFDTDGGDCTDSPECPAGSITWYEAVSYGNALSLREGLQACYELSGCTGEMGKGLRCSSVKLTTPTLYSCDGYRLPTAAEWEYAARAGTRTAYYSGEITAQDLYTECCEDKALEVIGWYCRNAGGRSHPVGGKAPNAWGLFDVAGNVSEWVNDPYTGGTEPGPHVDFGGELPSKASSLTLGGNFRGWPRLHRHAAGAIDEPWGNRQVGLGVGFRLVRSLPARDQ